MVDHEQCVIVLEVHAMRIEVHVGQVIHLHFCEVYKLSVLDVTVVQGPLLQILCVVVLAESRGSIG